MEGLIMENKFFVEKVYDIKENKFIVIEGSLIQGVVSTGMNVGININNSLMMTANIKKIEKSEEVFKCYKLMIIYEDEEERDLWMALNIGQEFINVFE